MKLRTLVLALAFSTFILLPVPSQALSTTTVENDNSPTAAIHQVLATWIGAVNDHDLAHVVSLYEDDAVLLPTLSPKIADTPELRQAYFEKFLAHQNLKGVVNEENIRLYGDIAINSGLYTFSYSKDGQMISVPARFSYVYHKTPAGWLIVDHHSSKLPQE